MLKNILLYVPQSAFININNYKLKQKVCLITLVKNASVLIFTRRAFVPGLDTTTLRDRVSLVTERTDPL